MPGEGVYQEYDEENVRIVAIRMPGLVGMSMSQIATQLEGLAQHLAQHEDVGRVCPPEGVTVGGVLVDVAHDGYFPFSVNLGPVTEEDDTLFAEIVGRAQSGDPGFARGGNL